METSSSLSSPPKPRKLPTRDRNHHQKGTTTMTADTSADTSDVPLNKLTTWPGNVGKTDADTGLAVSPLYHR
jgi:hypothetical protein